MAHPDIKNAENKYRDLLVRECRNIFQDVHMPSHDHLHHARVWENASLLLSKLSDAGMVTDRVLAEKVIIASFFHDTGLTVNPGPDHGRESRYLCGRFLNNTDLPEKERNEILDAVEKHDDKDYTGSSDPATLAAILSVADDMDAFGAAGIERYIEIYSLRGIAEDKLPSMVISNVASRFRHLVSTYSIFPDLVESQRKRAEEVSEYFTKLLK
jgi:HD superfamily phosphodiesterase